MPEEQTTPVEETPQAQTPAPPVSDRTQEQFEKLLDSNRQLFEQNKQLRDEFSQFRQSAQQPAQPAPQAPQQPQGGYDFYKTESDGSTYIDQQKLDAYLKGIEEEAKRAKETVDTYVQKTERQEIERQNKEAYASFPELNPENDKFDKEFYRQTRGILTDSMMNADEYGGSPLSFKEAADLVKNFRTPAEIKEEASKNAEEPAKPTEAQVAKEASSVRATSNPGTTAQSEIADEDLERLRRQTRMGGQSGDLAIAQRLAAIDHIARKSSE